MVPHMAIYKQMSWQHKLQDETDNISMNRNSSVSTTLSKAFMNINETLRDFTANDMKTHAFQKTYDKQRNELEIEDGEYQFGLAESRR